MPRNLLQEFNAAEDKDSLFAVSNKNFCEAEMVVELPTFTKKDLMSMVRAKELPQFLSTILSSTPTSSESQTAIKIYKTTFKILKTVAQSIQ